MSEVRRRASSDPFARIPNDTAQDDRLTAEALGVLTYICSLPDGWVIRDKQISRHFNHGRDWMRSIWRGLESAGYCQRLHNQRGINGRLGTVTEVADTPIFSTGGGLPATGQPATGQPAGGEPTTIQRNNDKEKFTNKNQPAAEGGGKDQPLPASPERLSFAELMEPFGVNVPASISCLPPKASKHMHINHLDQGQTQHAIEEFAARIVRDGVPDNPEAYWAGLCKRAAARQLNWSAGAEQIHELQAKHH